MNKYYEKDLSTNTTTAYYYFGDKLVAMSNNSTISYVHQDHLTGTSVMSDSSGALVSSITYDPFGLTRSGSVHTDIKFTGQRLDNTGLYYYGARYYDPTIGRFISPDTVVPNAVNPQAFNRYSYVLNNPLRYNDPSGNWPNWVDVKEKAGRVINAGKEALQVAVTKTVKVYQTAIELPGRVQEAAMHAVGITQVEYVQTNLVNDMPVYHLSESGLIGSVMDTLCPGAITVAPIGVFIRTEIYSSQELPQIISHESEHYAEQSTGTTPLWLASYYGEIALDWAYYGGNYWTGPYAANSAEQRARDYAGQPEAPIHDPWWQEPLESFTRSVESYLESYADYYYDYYW